MWDEGESLIEFDAQLDNIKMVLEFGIPKEEVDVSGIHARSCDLHRDDGRER